MMGFLGYRRRGAINGLGTAIGVLALSAAGCSSTQSNGAVSGPGAADAAGIGGRSARDSAGDGLPAPSKARIPTATGACPDFVEGKLTFSPDGNARDVQVWISDAAATRHGPLVFYWHSTGATPLEALSALGTAAISAIKDLGGIVAAPYNDPATGSTPWFLTAGGDNEVDLRVADEVLACAVKKPGIDVRRIHALGFSRGASQTYQMSWRRSGWLASVVLDSGGSPYPAPHQDDSNKFAAMLFHGGPTDIGTMNWYVLTSQYTSELKSAGHFALICDHSAASPGHNIPPEAPVASWQFFQDHPFGVAPEPYANGFPNAIPSYCTNADALGNGREAGAIATSDAGRDAASMDATRE